MRLMLFFDGRSPTGPCRSPESTSAERIAQEVKLPVRNPADPCLLLVHRQLQLAHDRTQVVQ